MPLRTEHSSNPVGPTLALGLAIFCLFAVLVVVWFNLSGHEENVEEKRAAARSHKLQALRREDSEKLNHFALIDKSKGTVQIPIAEAMRLVMTDLKNKPVQASAVKVENPYPSGLQAAPIASPSASASSSPSAVSAVPPTTGNPSKAPSPANGTALPAVPNAPELKK